MLIGVCGFTSTGSSAVVDFLKEYDALSVIGDKEFTLPYYPDGLEDLDYHLNSNCSKYTSSVVAIERFRRHMENYWFNQTQSAEKKRKLIDATDGFIEKLVQVSWNGYGSSDLQIGGGIFSNKSIDKFFYRLMKGRVIPHLEKLSSNDMDGFLRHRMEFSIRPENFDTEVHYFVKQILSICGADFTKPIVLNQPFSGNDPEKSFKYFDNPVAIVVDRDPRDNYMFAKKFLRRKGRQIPTDTVENFVAYYKNMRNNQPYQIENKRILNVKFEDMVYRYDETVKLINDFCGLNGEKRVRKIFDPNMSINNTQVYKRYPEYAEDIKYIEEMLSEYLYPFEQYGEMEIKGKMFSGDSPLNRKQ